MTTITCYVCHSTVPMELAHEHHRRPQAAGGTDADVINLCSGCHDNLHRVATMMMNPKRAGQVEDVVKMAYGSEGGRRRLLELARLVVQWMVRKRDGKLTDPNAEVELVLMVPAHIKAGLQVMAADIVRKGRPTGVSAFLRHHIINLVYQRFPQLRERHQKATEAGHDGSA